MKNPTPNAQQEAVVDAVLHTRSNIMVEALAGTGKTALIMMVLQALLRETDTRIIAMAYNAKARDEMLIRAVDLGIVRGGVDDQWKYKSQRVTICTVHQACYRAWREANTSKIPTNEKKLREMVDEAALHDPIVVKYGQQIRKLVSYAKQAGLGVFEDGNRNVTWLKLMRRFNLDHEIEESHAESLISICRGIYHNSLLLCRQEVDYDDQLLAPAHYKSKMPKYDWVWVDEAQDLSPLRLFNAMNMLSRRGRFGAVGDHHQAVYGFTGADSKSMDTIKDWTEAVVFPLSVTYRCPKVVVAAVNAMGITGYSAAEESPVGVERWVDVEPKFTPPIEISLSWERHVTYVPGLPERSFADEDLLSTDVILCRNAYPLVKLAYRLLQRRIPCHIEGRDIGLGLISLANKWPNLRSLDELAGRLYVWCSEQQRRFYASKDDQKAEEVGEKVDAVNVLISACIDEGGRTPRDLCRLIGDMFGDTKDGETAPILTLSTIHKAKGREWPRVFILGHNKYMPSKYARQPWQLEQEKNLLYIAMTRTQMELVYINVP